jgi:acetoacetyl-CoA synthetase
MRPGKELTEELKAAIRKKIRDNASPRHMPAKIVAVADIPRTRSNKISELAVRDVVHGRPVKNTEALANPDALKLFDGIAELQT